MRRGFFVCLVIALVLTLFNTGTPTTAQNSGSAAPIYWGNTNDGLPTYICAADAFASYYTLQQIQVLGLDVKHKFHLGIVPFLVDGSGGKYDISEEQRTETLAKGDWDCLLTTLDSVALHSSGIITTVVD